MEGREKFECDVGRGGGNLGIFRDSETNAVSRCSAIRVGPCKTPSKMGEIDAENLQMKKKGF